MSKEPMTENRAKRALMAACMGSMELAAFWRNQAVSAIAQGQSFAGFVARSHPCNRSKARAAYRLAAIEPKLNCAKCGAPVTDLDRFPGNLCLRCHGEIEDKKPLSTAGQISAMFRGSVVI